MTDGESNRAATIATGNTNFDSSLMIDMYNIKLFYWMQEIRSIILAIKRDKSKLDEFAKGKYSKFSHSM